MNERIRELSDIAYKNHLARNPHSSYGRRSDYDREFAELIVRECAQQAHDLADMLAMHRDKSGAEIAESVGNTIKEHFGVEE
jgi:hypothetical protein